MAVRVRCCQCLREAAMVPGRYGLRAPDGWVEVFAKELALEPASVVIRVCPPCIQPEPRAEPIPARHYQRGPSWLPEEPS